MKYVRVEWLHTDPQYPVVLYSEMDDDHWELRKVEEYVDGHRTFADQNESTGDTTLSVEPIPDFAQIAADPEFRLAAITREVFDAVWANRSRPAQ